MTELKKVELDNLLEKYSKEEIAEQLLFYKDLDGKGNVYYENAPENHYSIRQLILMSSNLDEKTVNELLNCSFTKNKEKQSRNISKYNTHRNILMLAGSLSRQYKTEFKNRAPRTKKTKETKELLDCHSQICNWYPPSYLKHVKKYIEENPLKEWHKDKLDDKFTQTEIDGIVKYICKECNKNLMKKSRSSHLNFCKGKK